MILELDGHHVTEAPNGAEALSSFRMGEFDLVITDLEMPVMDGSELATSLKLSAPALPILMVTGSGRARRNAENPVDSVLGKPFTVSELRSAVDNLLSPNLAQLNAGPC
jgi:CheY-like chemotaxis protein